MARSGEPEKTETRDGQKKEDKFIGIEEHLGWMFALPYPRGQAITSFVLYLLTLVASCDGNAAGSLPLRAYS